MVDFSLLLGDICNRHGRYMWLIFLYYWEIYVIDMGDIWDMHGICIGYTWDIPGRYMGFTWELLGIYMENMGVPCSSHPG